MSETKICKKCGVEKSVDEFYASKVYKDGRRALCKACDAENNRLYRLAHGMRPRATSAKAIAEREGVRTCIACGRLILTKTR